MPIEKYEDVAAKWEIEFALRYTSFEAQMYKIIIKYLKIACNVRTVGLVGFMMNDTPVSYTHLTLPTNSRV